MIGGLLASTQLAVIRNRPPLLYRMEEQMSKSKNSIDGGFIVVPKNTLRSSEYKALKPTAKVVFQTMLIGFIRDKKKNPKNKVRMSINEISELSGISRTTVWRSVSALEDAGFLTTSNQGGLENNSSEYELEGRYLW